jgi:alpha-L-fucosidase
MGHYGIISPSSLGISSVANWTSKVLSLLALQTTIYTAKDGKTCVNLDFTSGNTRLLDTTNVAVYEQNGFSDQHGIPYTTMQWGAVRNQTNEQNALFSLRLFQLKQTGEELLRRRVLRLSEEPTIRVGSVGRLLLQRQQNGRGWTADEQIRVLLRLGRHRR